MVDAQFPTFDAVLQAGWQFSTGSLDGGAAPTVALNDIQLDFGSFINGYLGQILGPINNLLSDIQPILDILTFKVPVIDKTLIDIASFFGGDVENAPQFLDSVASLLKFASDFSSAGASGLPALHFGSIAFTGFDLREAPGGTSQTGKTLPANDPVSMLDMSGLASTGQLDSEADKADSTFGNDLSSFDDDDGSGTGGNISFPILDDPASLLNLLFGKDIVLFDFTTPQLVVSVAAQKSIPLPVFPIVDINFGFDFGVTARLGFGYDTYGIREALADKHPGNVAADLADGFYIDESIRNGSPTTEVGLTGGIKVGAGLDLAVVSVNLDAEVDIDLTVSAKTSGPTDSGLTQAYHEANDNDGKARLKEILDNVQDSGNALCAFAIDGDVRFRLYLEVSVPFVYDHEFNIINKVVFSFSLDVCPPTQEDLGSEDSNGILTLYTGPNENLRGSNYAQSNDDFELLQGGDGEVIVKANGAAETFDHVKGIVSVLGDGNNSLIVDSPLVDDNGNPIDETIIGGTGNDTIQAGGGDDVIAGGGGKDKIEGGASGHDTIYADGVGSLGMGTSTDGPLVTYLDGFGTLNPAHRGDATINGGQAGYSLIYGGYGDDVINGNATGNTIYGGPGNEEINAAGGDSSATVDGDFVAGGGGDDTILGGAGNDTLAGDGGANLVIGGNGTNLVYGGVMPGGYSPAALALYGDPAAQPEATNLVFGGTADQRLVSSYRGAPFTGSLGRLGQLPTNDPAAAKDGNDTITAGTGGDLVFGGFKQNTIYGGSGSGADTLVGATTSDTILGGSGNSLIYGRGSDLIHGDAGNSTIHGGPGHSTIFGDTGSDLIVGGNAGNTIYAGSGNTSVYSGDGIDSVLGGSGHDLIHGGGGTDTIQGGSGASTIFGDDGNDTIDGGSGNDVIDGDDGLDLLRGGTGNSTIYGGHGSDTIHGGPGNDSISGVGGNDDSIFGGSGNDTIQGGGAGDTIGGGEGNDRITAGTGPAQITGGSGNSTITGGAGFDVILGGTGNDSIQGGSGGDVITGGSGADTIQGGSGPETLYAGAGASILVGGSGPDLLVGGVAADRITAGSGADAIYAGQTGGNVIMAGIGTDIIHGSGGAGTPGHGDTISGGSGHSTIYGSAGDDSILGGSGAGEIDVGPGNATVLGGLGALLIVGGIGNDLLQAGTASALDTIMGGRGSDTITGNAGADALYGGYGRDSISGGTGASVIHGGYGIGKTIYGGSGDDTIYASDAGQDVITGGSGNDEIHGAGGGNTITGGTGNDTIEGGPGDDSIFGGSGSDLLAGDAGNDTIRAGDPASIGADTIYGDFATLQTGIAGDDMLFGNAGNDRIFGGLGNDYINPGTGAGTQTYEGGTSVGAGYVATPTPNPTPADPLGVVDPAAAATLPGNLPVAGLWVPLAGDPGSSLAQPGSTSMGAALAVSGDTRYVAWVDDRSGADAVYVAAQSGNSWSELAGSAEQGGVSGRSETTADPTLALLPDGTPVVAWTVETSSGTDIQLAMYSAAANGGAGGWVGLGTSLGAGGLSGTGHAAKAQLVVVGGTLVVAWLDTSGGVANVYAKTFDGTNWVALGTGSASGRGVTGSTAAIPAFSLATDGSDVALGWTQPAGAISQIYLKQESGGVWSALAGSASGGGLSNGLYPAVAPTVAYDAGSLFVAWQQYLTDPNSTGTIYDQAPVIYAAEYTAGAWSAAGAGAESGFGVSANSSINQTPVLASDNGTLVLGWSNSSIGDTSATTHLYVRQWNGTAFAETLPGQATADGVVSGQSPLEALHLAVDPNGLAFASWIDRGTATPGLHVAGTPTAAGHVLVADATHSVQSLLATAVSGDVIYVSNQASTSGLSLTAANNGVTLVGQNGGGAVIHGLVTITGSQITLQGLTVTGGITIGGAGDTLDAVRVSGGTVTVGGTGARVFNSQLAGGGLVLTGATGFELRGNTITAASTGIQINAGQCRHDRRQHRLRRYRRRGDRGRFHRPDLRQHHQRSTPVSATTPRPRCPATRSSNSIIGVASTVDTTSGGFGFTPGSGQNTDHRQPDRRRAERRRRAEPAGHRQRRRRDRVRYGRRQRAGLGKRDHAKRHGRLRLLRHRCSSPRSRATAPASWPPPTCTCSATSSRATPPSALLVSGVAGVRTSDNTFYTATGDNVRLQNGASGFEIQNSILWSESGYDIYVANDSQTGFFSDYNVLYAGDAGTLVYWTRDFKDILDWQDDVAEFDLHSTRPHRGQPGGRQAALRRSRRQRLHRAGRVGGQRLSSPSVDQGSALVEHDVQPRPATCWPTPASRTASPAGPPTPRRSRPSRAATRRRMTATTIISPAPPRRARRSQTVDLLKAGYSAADIDAGAFTVQFGGYTRSYAQQPADQGSITVLFFDAANDLLGSSTVSALNTTDSGR